MDLSHRRGEERHLAELYRITGELLLMQATSRRVSRAATCGKAVVAPEPPVVSQAAACFSQSIKIAQRQKAQSWELRATMSLARLYQDRGRQGEARSLLAAIYDRFTEGFETMDLREAKALLDELEANDKVLSAPELFTRIRKRVEAAAARNKLVQKPEFKTIKGAGHEVGDFFFVPKS